MKTQKKYLEVSEFGFIINSELFVALKIIEAIPKTIDSFSLINAGFTNLLTTFPVVANEYLYFFKVRFYNSGTALTAATYSIIPTGSVVVSSPYAIWNAGGTPAINYQKSWFLDNIFTDGFTTSDTFLSGHAFGLKINTS